MRAAAVNSAACSLAGPRVVAAGEEFKGLLIPLLGGMLADTRKEFEAFNACLKAKCEGGR